MHGAALTHIGNNIPDLQFMLRKRTIKEYRITLDLFCVHSCYTDLCSCIRISVRISVQTIGNQGNLLAIFQRTKHNAHGVVKPFFTESYFPPHDSLRPEQLIQIVLYGIVLIRRIWNLDIQLFRDIFHNPPVTEQAPAEA